MASVRQLFDQQITTNLSAVTTVTETTDLLMKYFLFNCHIKFENYQSRNCSNAQWFKLRYHVCWARPRFWYYQSKKVDNLLSTKSELLQRLKKISIVATHTAKTFKKSTGLATGKLYYYKLTPPQQTSRLSEFPLICLFWFTIKYFP